MRLHPSSSSMVTAFPRNVENILAYIKTVNSQFFIGLESIKNGRYCIYICVHYLLMDCTVYRYH